MSGHGFRLYRNVAGQNDQPRFPMPSQFTASRLERVFSSIQPLVAHSQDIPFRSYARRFFPYNSSSDNPRLVGRGNHGRPATSHMAIGQDNSSDSSTNAAFSTLQMDQSHSVPAVDSAPVGVANVVINIDLEPSPVSNEVSDVNNQIEQIGPIAPGRMSLPNQNRDLLGSLRVDTHNLEVLLGSNQDVRISFMNIWQYLLFLCVVLVKLLFDKITSIFVLISLSLIFVMGDKVVRKKATNQERSFKSIIAIIVIMPISIYLLYTTYNKENFFYSAILLFPDYDFVTFGDLLWIIIITDLVLKIVTVIVKSFVVLLPKSLLNQRSKATTYELVERISRLYRSLATIQPWLSYFLDGYSGPRKIFGVLLSAFYMLCKGPELIVRIKELRTIVSKFLFSGGYGTNPSQLELDEAGGRCPICHDEFTSPLRLSCTHIFCESCVMMWFTRERTCPMCRTNIMSEDPAYRDGGTSYLPQIY